jgi:hypothetical protein
MMKSLRFILMAVAWLFPITACCGDSGAAAVGLTDVAKDVNSFAGYNVKAFGAAGDGVMDDHDAIALAIVTCQAAGGGRVCFPSGTYRINSKIEIDNSIPVTFEGMNAASETSRIVAGAPMDALFHFSSSSSQQFYQFRNLCLRCNHNASYGIYGEHLPYLYVEHCVIIHAPVAGLHIENGWCGHISDTYITSGLNGIELGTANNGFLIEHCVICENTGIGIVIAGGQNPLVIRDCIIEDNDGTGVYFQTGPSRSVLIEGCSMESNASAGIVYAKPAATIKATVIVNGTALEATMGSAYPVYGLVFRSNYTASQADATSVIYLIGAENVEITNNTEYRDGVPMVGLYGNRSYACTQGLYVRGNRVANASQIEVDDGLGTLSTNTVYAHTWRDADVPPVNYYPQNFLGYSAIATNGGLWGGTLTRAGETFRGQPVMDIYDSDSTSALWGWTFDIDNDYPWLNGQLVWFGLWYKYTDTTGRMNVRLGSSTDGYHTVSYAVGKGTWQYVSRLLRIPASGATAWELGFQKFGNTDAHLYVSQPILALAGTHRDDIPPGPVTWQASAAPTGGAWRVGDIVWSSDPSPGEPLGWMCTKAGSPGTWAKFCGLESASAYSTSHVKTRRALNANGRSIAVVSDVLCTLIEDLKSAGVLKAP